MTANKHASMFRNDGTPTGISIVAPSGTRTKYVIRVTGNGKDTMLGIGSEMGLEQAYKRAVDIRLEHVQHESKETLRAAMLSALPLLLVRHKLRKEPRIVYDILPDD